MKPLRAKIRCIAVLAHALTPFAVITANFRNHTYVYLDLDERNALADLWREEKSSLPYVPSIPGEFPLLVRGYAIDAETGEVADGALSSRPGSWISAEGLWVRTDVAEDAVAALERWRKKKKEDHRPDTVAAPNWRTLTCIRALARAHEMPDPGVNWRAAS